MLIIGVIAGLLGLVFVLYVAVDVPSVESIRERQIAQSTKIYDSTGKVLLWEMHQGERRTHISLEEVSPAVRNATVAIEDSEFYNHNGFSVSAIFRALIIDLLAGDLAQGGSTITQQLVKRALLVPDKTITRKIKEVVIAIKLERQYSKDEILELYINEIPYGAQSYGIESAAQTYFGKSAHDVSLAEAAYLAAIPNAPTRLSPYGSHRDELESRKNTVLSRMADLGYISTEEKDAAKNTEVTFLPPRKGGILAPHFVIYVREQLSEMYGEENVERLGLSVTTTLNASLQAQGEVLVKKYSEDSEIKYNAKNAALIAISPENGGILTMVGSRDFFDLEREGNFNVTLARRQPGSTIKPIVYAAAFNLGYTPETVVFDLPTDFDPRESAEYRPVNYDGKFRGPVTLRSALAQSLNVPSVKVLYLAGMHNVLSLARAMGITSLNDPDRYGLSLVLGGGEVSPLELTGAYSVFASGGIKHPVHAIERVTNRDGEELFVHNDSPENVINAQIAHTLSNILSDNNARLPVFAENTPLNYKGLPVAAKTGTTNDYRDAWAVGYTTKIAIGVWLGNNDNTPMDKKIAGYVVAPLWRSFMDTAIKELPLEPFPSYQKILTKKPVLNGEWRGSYIEGSSPNTFIKTEIHDILHWVERENPTGDIPTSPNKDAQYESWEYAVRTWAKQQNLPPTIPYTPTENTTQLPTITIENITTNTSSLSLPYKILPETPLTSIDIFINGEFYRKDNTPTSPLSLPLYLFQEGDGHVIQLRALTKNGDQLFVEQFIENVPQ